MRIVEKLSVNSRTERLKEQSQFKILVNKIKTLDLGIELQDTPYFDSFLQKEIMGYPVYSLRTKGSGDTNRKRYDLTYRYHTGFESQCQA